MGKIQLVVMLKVLFLWRLTTFFPTVVQDNLTEIGFLNYIGLGNTIVNKTFTFNSLPLLLHSGLFKL